MKWTKDSLEVEFWIDGERVTGDRFLCIWLGVVSVPGSDELEDDEAGGIDDSRFGLVVRKVVSIDTRE